MNMTEKNQVDLAHGSKPSFTAKDIKLTNNNEARIGFYLVIQQDWFYDISEISINTA